MNIFRNKYLLVYLYLLLAAALFFYEKVYEKGVGRYSMQVTMPWSWIVRSHHLLHPGNEITRPRDQAVSEFLAPALMNTTLLWLLSCGVSRFIHTQKTRRGYRTPQQAQ